jgi:tetratricopeptide (TPR) repeat protein
MQRRILKSIICLATWICIAGITQTYAQQQGSEELRRHIRYAQTAYSMGEYPNALKEYQEAFILAPNYLELYKAIGDVYEKLGSTADLKAAITYYQGYVKLAPNAADARQIQDKIYDLEYLWKEKVKWDGILDDLSGEWVAIDNIEVSMNDNVKILFMSDVIFKIAEIQKTGTYSVTMAPEGSRFYSANLIEKTVHVVPAKDNVFTFTFIKTTVHTPNSAGYEAARVFGSAIGTAVKKDWVVSLTDAIVNTAQQSDVPNRMQTVYTFALRYDEGKLVGLINTVINYADPTRQQTIGNNTREITFVKNNYNLSKLLQVISDNQPDVLHGTGAVKPKDKWGKFLSGKEVVNKLYAFDPQLGKAYRKAKNTETAMIIMGSAALPVTAIGAWLVADSHESTTTGWRMIGASIPLGVIGFSVGIPATSRKTKLINRYNKQIMQQHKNKPIADLRFGITSSGEIGLALTF